jgi:hypothetical protein
MRLVQRRQLLIVIVCSAATLAAYLGHQHGALSRHVDAGFVSNAAAAKAPHKPVKGAFVMLVAPGKGDEVRQSLGMLYENVLDEHPRPVLLFYGDDVDAAERDTTGLLAGAPTFEI